MIIPKFFSIIIISLFLIVTLSGCANNDVAKYNEKQQETKDRGGNQEPQNQQGSITYTKVQYEDLPVDLKAMANLEPKEGFTEVVQGKGDNQYVFISLGVRATAGYAINIESVENVKGQIKVVYSEKKPGPDEVVAQVITYPWIVIKLETTIPITSVVKK